MSTESPPTPQMGDIDNLSKTGIDALEIGDLSTFVKSWQTSYDLQRPYSWEIQSKDQMKELLAKLDFKGIYKTTLQNAAFIWYHERSHQNAASNRSIPSVIRVGEVDGSDDKYKYYAYLEISISHLLNAAGQKPYLVMQYLGEVFVAPDKESLGYPGETQTGLELLRLADALNPSRLQKS